MIFLNQKCDIAIRFQMPGRRITVDRPISPILTLKLVAMATFFERSEKEGKILNLRSKTYHTWKFDENRSSRSCFVIHKIAFYNTECITYSATERSSPRSPAGLCPLHSRWGPVPSLHSPPITNSCIRHWLENPSVENIWLRHWQHSAANSTKLPQNLQKSTNKRLFATLSSTYRRQNENSESRNYTATSTSVCRSPLKFVECVFYRGVRTARFCKRVCARQDTRWTLPGISSVVLNRSKHTFIITPLSLIFRFTLVSYWSSNSLKFSPFSNLKHFPKTS